MEKDRKISLLSILIKVIIAIIIILTIVWAMAYYNRGLSDSINVLTEDIFDKNLERMKEVGKEYFTTERLPKKIGDVKVLTLKEMYSKNLILELTDKYGNSCSSDTSYVSIEKYENEYQMKVYLECGEEDDYIIVIMGCYDYCDNDICEPKDDKPADKLIEYQYVKTTGGKWSDYGKWSKWSKVPITSTSYRKVDTKKVKEEYTYDKTITETLYAELQVSCPSGYSLTSDGKSCYKTIVDTSYANPTCPSLDGWINTGRDGFTCKYSKTIKSSDYTLSYVRTSTGSSVPADTSKYKYVQVSADYVYDCENSCAYRWVYTYKVYKKVYDTVTKTKTDTATCPSGYSNVNGTCSKSVTDTKTNNAVCPSGYSNVNGICSKSITDTKTDTATCPSGYSKTSDGSTCSKTDKSYEYKSLIKSCPSEYSKTSDGSKCYKKVLTTKTITQVREVTYYRYKIREYIGGTTTYKWSTSKNDKKLLNAGYKLTGKTR